MKKNSVVFGMLVLALSMGMVFTGCDKKDGGAASGGKIKENAATDFKYTLNEAGNGMIVQYLIKERKTVNIPAKIEGYPVVEIGEYFLQGFSSVESVTIPDGVTAIGSKVLPTHGYYPTDINNMYIIIRKRSSHLCWLLSVCVGWFFLMLFLKSSTTYSPLGVSPTPPRPPGRPTPGSLRLS